MKKSLVLVAMVFFVALSFGCSIKKELTGTELESTEQKNAGYYVMDKKDGKILVVNTEPKDFSSTGGEKEYYDAIWLSNAPEDIKIGQQVEFEIEGVILTSYPGQGKAGEVSIIPSSRSNEASLSVEEALYSALTSKKVNRNKVLVVTSIKYYDKTELWQIDIKETKGDKVFSIKVNDK